MEMLIANPEVRREKRARAFEALVKKVKELAREFNFKTIFMSVSNKGLVERLKGVGFTETDQGCSQMLLKVGV
jgi:replicative DNA helicase